VRLHDFGQAVWLDFLARSFLLEGGLKRLVEQDRLTGVTSNPSIFEKAIAGSADYDQSLNTLETQGDRDVMALYERLAIEDIRHAADTLRPVYEATKRQDGYVSLEVSPYLAMDTEATVAEARRLWQSVCRRSVSSLARASTSISRCCFHSRSMRRLSRPIWRVLSTSCSGVATPPRSRASPASS
jgi:transaldolase / glucose-6-phosphate isomerase